MAELSGRRILITGASRGVGLETTRLFLAEGAEVLAVARDASRLERAARELSAYGGRLSTLAADLESPSAIAPIVAAVQQRWGALDVLLNNAGVQIDGEANGLVDGSEAVLERSLAVNLWAPYRLCLSLLPLLRKGREPRIANVSSGAGTFAAMKDRKIASYRLSKWSLNGLTLLLASELAGEVSVNAFDPGWVKTDLGGPNAPGSPVESARGALSLLTLPFAETGKFWKDGQEIPF
ncbi:MAG TPA: SDR family NAD(P)-dependent oxidoreductase [Polyangiaceae bacterium]|jgi:NAD(P)-dependent dehydrogenase (short-subunit alcohol dehydrogenase family)|nr:SDR family NAD(P)-dependent oxidoreductase [Polyangiaceae bacterium]